MGLSATFMLSVLLMYSFQYFKGLTKQGVEQSVGHRGGEHYYSSMWEVDAKRQ